MESEFLVPWSNLLPVFQNLDLFSDGFNPIIDFLSLRFEIGGGCAQLPGVVVKPIAIMFQRVDNSLQFHFHTRFTPQ